MQDTALCDRIQRCELCSLGIYAIVEKIDRETNNYNTR